MRQDAYDNLPESLREREKDTYMKKYVAFFIMIALLARSEAQTHSFSISGGLNRTNITSDFEQGWKSNTGFTGDFSYDYMFANGITVGIGFRFHQTGFNDDMHLVFSATEIADINLKYQYEYIGFPLKFGYGYVIKRFSWFAKIGLCPAFLTKGQLTTSLVDGILNDPAIPLGITDFKKNASTFDLSGLAEFNAGYQLFNKWTPFLSFSYQHSLIAMGKDHFKGMNVRHYGFIFSFGIKYDL